MLVRLLATNAHNKYYFQKIIYYHQKNRAIEITSVLNLRLLRVSANGAPATIE